MFFFDLSSLKIPLSNFLIFCSQQYGQQMNTNIRKSLVAFSRKFHLKIAKFQFLPIFWLGDFKSNFQLQIKITSNESVC